MEITTQSKQLLLVVSRIKCNHRITNHNLGNLRGCVQSSGSHNIFYYRFMWIGYSQCRWEWHLNSNTNTLWSIHSLALRLHVKTWQNPIIYFATSNRNLLQQHTIGNWIQHSCYFSFMLASKTFLQRLQQSSSPTRSLSRKESKARNNPRSS